MPSRWLYTTPISEASQTVSREQLRRQLSSLAAIEGQSPVETTGLEPGQERLEGAYRATGASLLAQQLAELVRSDGIETVPLVAKSGTDPTDGYYSLSDVEVSPGDPRGGEHWEYHLTIEKEGTRRSHWRAVTTEPQSVSHDFGTQTGAYVGVPASATRVRWVDTASLTFESATLVDTVTTEHGDVDRYDADAPSITNPTLIYDVTLGDVGPVDPILWDDRGHSSKTTATSAFVGSSTVGSTTVAQDVVQWQRVYRSDHEYQGTPILDNGRLRVRLEPQGMTAERYASGLWSSVALGTGSWELFDADVVEVGAAEIHAQLEFEDTNASGTYFSLDATLKRGFDDLLFVVPPNESGPIPSGLQTYLDPIAAATTRDAQASAGLVPREDVRK